MSDPFAWVASVDQAVNRLERLLAPRPTYTEASEFYGYEPLPLDVFLAGLSALGVPGGRSYLEVGCGIGTKLAIASAAGWEATGLELDAETAAVAAKLVPEAIVTVEDARDFTGYGAFDAVFMFKPLMKDVAQAALERLIVAQMAPGSLAFFAHAVEKDLGAEVARHVWAVK
jgi:SAM-dependent methyltransferase